ncbi:alpha/beta-hydrolase [Backusella circina FSU 941]|nr:alpha/beta-hydrolase [Backusella circina FSU 941]
MLRLISAGIATFYIFEVAIFAFFTVIALHDTLINDLFKNNLRRFLFVVEVACSAVQELSLQLLVVKWLFIKVASFFGAFNYKLCYLMWVLDYATLAGLVVIYYRMLKEKPVIDSMVRDIDPDSKPLDSVLNFEDIKKLINPFWTPANVIIHPNITYANNEEKKQALETTNQDFSQPRKMMLDVYTSNNVGPSLRPVIVHIHGGAWLVGNKDNFYPHQKLLVSENNWIAVNIGYRLAPKNPYPTHLYDVKRAIRWIKQNIASFGGDPNYIVLSGDSAGAHLASLAAASTNDPQYQPGFEDVDTSVRGVVSLSGALDITYTKESAMFFSKRAAKLETIDYDFLKKHNPVDVLEKAKQENKLLPHLLLAGQRDTLVDHRVSIKFKETYDKVMGPICQLLLLPAGHHVSYMTWSPRALYGARVIQLWCLKQHVEKK